MTTGDQEPDVVIRTCPLNPVGNSLNGGNQSVRLTAARDPVEGLVLYYEMKHLVFCFEASAVNECSIHAIVFEAVLGVSFACTLNYNLFCLDCLGSTVHLSWVV